MKCDGYRDHTTLALDQGLYPFHPSELLSLLTIMVEWELAWYLLASVLLYHLDHRVLWPWALTDSNTDSSKICGIWSPPPRPPPPGPCCWIWAAVSNKLPICTKYFSVQPTPHRTSGFVSYPRLAVQPIHFHTVPLPLMSLPRPVLKPSRNEKIMTVSVCSALQFSSLN